MKQTCLHCQQYFEITSEDLAFYDQVSPVIAGVKYSLPAPTLCPDCRLQRRQLFRNERVLYKRKSNLSGKDIVSMYAPEKPYVIYDQDEFWSDAWDPLEYGVNFNFQKTFSEQFFDLNLRVPHMSLFTTHAENSYYTNHTLHTRNCYLLYGGGNCEDCLYGRFLVNCKNSAESMSLLDCQWCYEGVCSSDCYQCVYFDYCRNCRDSWFLQDCTSCESCFLCVGLHGKKYCFLNEQLDETQYRQKIAQFFPLTQNQIEKILQQRNELSLKVPHKAMHIYASEDCTGDMITGSKNARECFDIQDAEDVKYMCYTPKSTMSMDGTYAAPDGVSYCYETGSTVGVSNSLATFLCWYGDRLLYSRECHHCHDVFGCVSLKRKSYCIFNTQYTQEEYETILPQIIEHMKKTGEWGEYFHPNLSLMGYNETIAMETHPLEESEVRAKKWNWFDRIEEQSSPHTKHVPETIQDTTDAATKEIFTSQVSDKAYKIIPQELILCRTLGMPLPHLTPDERHQARIKRKLPSKLWKRNCHNCAKAITTNYHPEKKQDILCDVCYYQYQF